MRLRGHATRRRRAATWVLWRRGDRATGRVYLKVGIRVIRPRIGGVLGSVRAPWPFGRVRIVSRWRRVGRRGSMRPGAQAPGRCPYCNRRDTYFPQVGYGLCTVCNAYEIDQIDAMEYRLSDDSFWLYGGRDFLEGDALEDLT